MGSVIENCIGTGRLGRSTWGGGVDRSLGNCGHSVWTNKLFVIRIVFSPAVTGLIILSLPTICYPPTLSADSKNNGWAIGKFEKAVSLIASAPWLPGDILKFPITVTKHSQVDILKCALDADDRHHMMVALPTGYGKTLPMLLLGHLLPAGTNLIYAEISFC